MSKRQDDRAEYLKTKAELKDPSAYIPHFAIPLLLSIDATSRYMGKQPISVFVLMKLAENPTGITTRTIAHFNKISDIYVYHTINQLRKSGDITDTHNGEKGYKAKRICWFITKQGEQTLIKYLKALNKEIKRYKSLYDGERKHIWNSIRNPDPATAKSYRWQPARKGETEVLQSPDTEDI